MNDHEIIEIAINEDIDRYEAEMWKGLSPRHIKGGFLVLLTVTGFYILTNMVFLVPPFLAVFISLIMAVPVGIWNFIKVEEMDFKTFIARKWKYAFGRPYIYEASFFGEITDLEKEKRKSEKKNEKAASKAKPKKEKKKKMKAGKNKAENETQEIITGEYLQEPNEQMVIPYMDDEPEVSVSETESFMPEDEDLSEEYQEEVLLTESEDAAEEMQEEEMPAEEEQETEPLPEENTEPEEGPAQYAELFGVMARQKEMQARQEEEKEQMAEETHEEASESFIKEEPVAMERTEEEPPVAPAHAAAHQKEHKNIETGGKEMYKFGFYEELIASLKQTIEKQEQTIEKQEELIKMQKAYIIGLEGGVSR